MRVFCWCCLMLLPLLVLSRGQDNFAPATEIRTLLDTRDFETAAQVLERQLSRLEDLPPHHRLDLLNAGAELMVRTWRWETGFRLLALGKETALRLPLESAADSLLLSERYLHFGDLLYSHSYISTHPQHRRWTRGFYQRALELLPQSHNRSEIHRKIGMEARLLKDQVSAREHLLKALELAPAKSPDYLRAHQMLGFYYFKSGFEDLARFHLSRSDTLLHAPYIQGITAEDSIFQWYTQGDLYGDRTQYKKVADRMAQSPCYSLVGAFALSKLGNASYREGKYADALACYHQIQDIYRISPQTIDRQLTLKDNIANTWFTLGDLNMALPYYQEEVDILLGLDQDDPQTQADLARARHNKAACMYKLYHDESIIPELIGLVQHHSSEELPPEDLGQLHSLLGFVFQDIDHDSKALLHFMNSNRSFASVRQDMWPEMAVNYASIGHCYEALEQPEAARREIARATQLLREGRKTSSLVSKATAANLIGNYHLQKGNWKPAAEFYQMALTTLSADFGNKELLSSPPVESLALEGEALDALHGKARALRQLYGPEAHDSLLAMYPRAIAFIHALRQGQSAEASQIRFSARTRPVFEAALDLAWTEFKRTGNQRLLETAFEQAEQSRSMVLLAAISAQDAARQTGVPDRILLAQRDLLSQKDRLLRQKTLNPGSAAATNQELARITHQQDSLLSFLRDSFPRYYELMYETSTLPVREIQQQLKGSNTALLEYFMGDSLLFTFAITPDTFAMTRLTIDSLFRADLRYLQQVMVNKYISDDAGDYHDAALRMYRRLFPEPEVDLPERLVLVPDGGLNYLSFEALVTQHTTSDMPHFLDLHYLLEDHVVTYDYSFSVRASREPAPPRETTEGILALAPSFDSLSGLSDLPSTRDNIQGLAQRYQGVFTLTGPQATETAFRELAPQYSILDLATHGSMDTLNPMNCCLYFQSDSSGDGRLFLGELYNMDLNARMAILEACESGIGKHAKGEGVMSLARGFTYAGCQTIVTSLWNVAEEEITHAIMNDFYQGLADGAEVDVALAQAKRKNLAAVRQEKGARAQFFKPFFWAEMVIVGDTSPVFIKEKTGPKYLWWAIVLLLAGLGGWAWWRNRFRSRA